MKKIVFIMMLFFTSFIFAETHTGSDFIKIIEHKYQKLTTESCYCNICHSRKELIRCEEHDNRRFICYCCPKCKREYFMLRNSVNLKYSFWIRTEWNEPIDEYTDNKYIIEKKKKWYEKIKY